MFYLLSIWPIKMITEKSNFYLKFDSFVALVWE